MENIIRNYEFPDETRKYIKDKLVKKDFEQLNGFDSKYTKLVTEGLSEKFFNDISQLITEDIDKDKEIQDDLRKLSFDLWRDFNYYRKFSFKREFISPIFKESLKKLKMKEENNEWVSTTPINDQLVIENCLNYILINAIWIEKKKMEMDKCPNCSGQLEYSSMCPKCKTAVIAGRYHKVDETKITEPQETEFSDSENDLENRETPERWNAKANFDKWRCDSCSEINHRYDEVCAICHKANEYLKECFQCERVLINSQHEFVCCSCKRKLKKDCRCTDIGNHRIYASEKVTYESCKFTPKRIPEKNKLFLTDSMEGKIFVWKCTFCKLVNSEGFKSCNICRNMRYSDINTLCFYCGAVNGIERKACLKCKRELDENRGFLSFCSIS